MKIAAFITLITCRKKRIGRDRCEGEYRAGVQGQETSIKKGGLYWRCETGTE